MSAVYDDANYFTVRNKLWIFQFHVDVLCRMSEWRYAFCQFLDDLSAFLKTFFLHEKSTNVYLAMPLGLH